MKTKLIFLVFILLVAGCNTQQRKDKATDPRPEERDTTSESSVVHDPTEALWAYEHNPRTQEFEIRQLRPVDEDTLMPEAVEKIINASWPRVQVEFVRTSNDTAYIAIPHSQVLTQQMGTTGAKSFMIAATYSFTELKGIAFVAFDFEEGDHAIPGVYGRDSWER